MKTTYTFSRQSGFSLVELMVAMTIGLLLLAALSYFLLGIKQAGRTTDDLSRMQENGRYAIDTLAASIRQAGYKDNPDQAFTTIYGAAALATTQGVGGASDSLTLRHAPQDATETDCSGVTPVTGTPVVEVFAITDGALTCNGVIVAPNVADLQLSLAQGTAAGATTAYAAPGAIDDNSVVSVQVQLLLVSPRTGVAASAQTYVYNGASVTANDGRLRQVYTAATALRNRVQNEPHPLPAPAI